MYKLDTTKRFDKALKLCKKRGYPIEDLRKAIAILAEKGCLPKEYKPHILHGNHEGEWEDHINPDWLLVWEQNDEELTPSCLLQAHIPTFLVKQEDNIKHKSPTC